MGCCWQGARVGCCPDGACGQCGRHCQDAQGTPGRCCPLCRLFTYSVTGMVAPLISRCCSLSRANIASNERAAGDVAPPSCISFHSFSAFSPITTLPSFPFLPSPFSLHSLKMVRTPRMTGLLLITQLGISAGHHTTGPFEPCTHILHSSSCFFSRPPQTGRISCRTHSRWESTTSSQISKPETRPPF